MESNTFPVYAVGEPVIYQNGDRFELGIVKTVCENNEYFVNYHTGDTAARTHARHLHKIANDYAFVIARLNPDEFKIDRVTIPKKDYDKLVYDSERKDRLNNHLKKILKPIIDEAAREHCNIPYNFLEIEPKQTKVIINGTTNPLSAGTNIRLLIEYEVDNL